MTLRAVNAPDASHDDNALTRVIRRIQKLLARTSGRGATEAEAATASKMVQDLMTQYNLDMATVEAAGASHADDGHVRVKEKFESKTKYKWQRTLAKYVAEANFCYYLITKEYVKDKDGNKIVDKRQSWKYDYDEGDYSHGYRMRPVHIFVGRKANVISAQLMLNYLIEAISDMLPEGVHHLSKYANSWREGAADRLCDRLSDRKEQLIREHDERVRKMKEEAEEAARKDEAMRLAAHTFTKAEREKELKAGSFQFRAPTPSSEEPERPDVDTGDWKPGDNAKSIGEADAEKGPTPNKGSHALVLASVYASSEADANYEMAHGYEPGTLAKRRRQQKEREAKIAAEIEAEIAEDVKKEETEKERARRERREAKEAEKNDAKWERQRERERKRRMSEYMKRDHDAYHDGVKAADKIGLDPQVKAKKETLKLK